MSLDMVITQIKVIVIIIILIVIIDQPIVYNTVSMINVFKAGVMPLM